MRTPLDALASFSPACQQALVVLHYADSGCEAAVIEQFAGVRPGGLKEALAALKAHGLIQEVQEYFFLAAYTLTEEQLTAFSEAYASAREHAFFHLLYLRHHCEYRPLFRQCREKLESLLAGHSWLTAKRFLDCVHSLLISCRIPVGNTALCRDFILTSHFFLSLHASFPWLNRRTLAWYLKVRGLALAIKDDHLLALMDLSIGYMEINDFSFSRKFSYAKFLRRGLELSLSTGDETLIAGALPYNTLMYYMNGEFIKAINCVYSQFYQNKNRSADAYHRTLYANGVLSAIYSGEYDIALDIGQTGRRTAEKLGREQDALLFDAYMAYVHLLKQEEKPCLEIVNSILGKGDDAVLTYSGLWAARVLAYYHCLRGDLEASYTCYISRLRKASLTGVIHTGYISAHFMLEMLARFHIAGFPQPMRSSIYEELEKSIHSGNLPLRASALRLKGEICAHERGWTDPEAADCLQAALGLARSLNAPIEQAKTLFFQARILLHAHRRAEARACLDEALSIHARYKSPPVPDEVRPLLPQSEAGPAARPHAAMEPAQSCAEQEGQFFAFQSEPMRDMRRKIELLAPKNTPVLILGESGVGKERAARQLHTLSGRTGEFVPVNLASVPEELFESEFYGHEKGSFTGAHSRKAGLFEIANGGTLFLDEVGDIPPRLQVKLLRVLQEKQFMRVGGTKLLDTDFRLVSATNKDLELEVREGRFREDLFYRITVVSLTIPPLRERGNDILLLADFFLKYFLDFHNIPTRVFQPDDIAFIMSYSWPGNIRELKNYIERFVLLSENEHPGNAGTAVFLPACPEDAPTPEEAPELFCPETNLFARLPDGVFSQGFPSMERIRDQYFEFIYERSGGVVNGPGGMLDILKISKATAYHWIRRLQLNEKFARKMVRLDP